MSLTGFVGSFDSFMDDYNRIFYERAIFEHNQKQNKAVFKWKTATEAVRIKILSALTENSLNDPEEFFVKIQAQVIAV